ncbi:hypothetical protein D0T49_06505 [Paludibacter sp. 221]|uniref:hypothetical protein n=1 Tax=Paludibacter sp. 221 TaxID=2302939 RepID=UPI0013D380A7|nr:hypothetical protein [Paludibacter sp. 221]NDV46695.1 hypothetical protein [Paludibacter sp. 221]
MKEIDYTFIIIGVLAIVYGIYTIVIRTKNPEKLTKLTEMKKRMGDKKAIAVHTFSYSVLPIIFGLVFIVSELIKNNI